MTNLRPESFLTPKFLLGVIFSTAAFAAFLGLTAELQARALRQDAALVTTAAQLKPGGSLAYYTAVADQAVAAQPVNAELARLATFRALELDSHNVSAWNRLVYLDLVSNGQLTKEGLAALYKSYEVSPYGDLTLMIWRTDLATQIWSSLPDDLRALTFGQIEMISRFGTSWEWRIQNCKYNPHKELYEAVCALSPGVVRPQQSG